MDLTDEHSWNFLTVFTGDFLFGWGLFLIFKIWLVTFLDRFRKVLVFLVSFGFVHNVLIQSWWDVARLVDSFIQYFFSKWLWVQLTDHNYWRVSFEIVLFKILWTHPVVSVKCQTPDNELLWLWADARIAPQQSLYAFSLDLLQQLFLILGSPRRLTE